MRMVNFSNYKGFANFAIKLGFFTATYFLEGLKMWNRIKKERFIKVLVVLVLIFILFFSSVTFGQVVSLPSDSGKATGVVYASDGVTPLLVADVVNGSYIELYNATSDLSANICVSDTKGLYTTKTVPSGKYGLRVYFKSKNVGNSSIFAIQSGQLTQVDLRTSRISTS